MYEPCRPPKHVFYSDLYCKKPLKLLDLTGWIVTDDEMRVLSRACKQLTELQVPNTHSLIHYPTHPLTHSHSLTELQVPNSPLTDIGLGELSMLKEIQKLNLDKCKLITDAGIIAFVKTHAKVVHLSLQETVITERAVESITQGLKKLEYLNLKNCVNLSDFALVALGERPFQFQPIKFLDLSDCERFTDKVNY